ncbi:MAG TPA: DAK2 domain-containing protein [Anaerolineae bacterium]|nr:DAK2 domain-containing protein [Anaerolineae bacterium]
MAARQPPLLNINGADLKDMVQASLSWLKAHQQSVNALNVFPVPDGDTGTNMLLTMQAAWAEVDHVAGASIHRVAHAVAHGALMGARGNSGVILSQLWRGFARSLDAKATMNAAEFAAAMREGCNTAYKGVIKPVEGTILTVSRATAEAAEAAAKTTQDLMTIFDQVLTAGKEAVARTPMQLDILRQAGVVDAGGQGLAVILEGMLRFLRGEPVDVEPIAVTQAFTLGANLEGIEAGQDFELVFDLRPRQGLDWDAMYGDLSKFGTSIQVGGGDDELKIHIHVPTDNFYKTQEYAFTLGAITRIAVENLQEQMAALQAGGSQLRGAYADLKADDIATIAVASGDGLARVFESLGASLIIPGGQTMNPSTEDFVKAMQSLPCERAILIPNNGNVVMAARQAVDLAGTLRESVVVPTRTMPQGVAAMLAFNAQSDLETNARLMEAATRHIHTGEVTVATRSVQMNGVVATEGQPIGLIDDELAASGQTTEDVVWQLLDQMHVADRELVTLYYGDSVTANAASALAEAIRARFGHLELEVVDGGQPYYSYILSVE